MGCIHSQVSKSNKRRNIRKSTISKPRLITSPISTYSFSSDEKRPVPQSFSPSPSPSPSSTIKARSDSQSSTESTSTAASSTESHSTAATSQSTHDQTSTPTLIITESTPPRPQRNVQEDDEAEEEKTEYLTQAEITSITTRVTKFVSSLTNYGQLIEKTHLAIQADLSTILNLVPLPLPPIPIPAPTTPGQRDGKDVEVVKISLLSSHRSMKRLTRSKSKLSSMLSAASSPSSIKSDPKTPSKTPPKPPSSSSPPSPEQFKATPPYTVPSPTLLARRSLTTLQTTLSSTYTSQKSNFTQKYWPLITLLPRNWITFSRMGREEQENDVRRHLRRRKGEFRARDGLLLGLIRGLSYLAKESCPSLPSSPSSLSFKCVDGEEGVGGIGNERAFELFEEEVDKNWERILKLLKAVERENREKKGDQGEEGREWSPAMKWRVFGLVAKERIRIIGEKRGEILRERVGLSAVLLGVFEDVGEGGGEVV